MQFLTYIQYTYTFMHTHVNAYTYKLIYVVFMLYASVCCLHIVSVCASSRAGGAPGWLLNLRPGNLDRKTTSINNAGDPIPGWTTTRPPNVTISPGTSLPRACIDPLRTQGLTRHVTRPAARADSDHRGPRRPTAGQTPAQIFPWSDPRNA